jgi:hypothetical protein
LPNDSSQQVTLMVSPISTPTPYARRARRAAASATVLALAISAIGCGDSSAAPKTAPAAPVLDSTSIALARGTSNNFKAIKFAITPRADTLQIGGSVQLAASVTWSDGRAHDYTVVYSVKGGGGTITQSGLFSTGSVAGNFLVVAACSCALADTAHAVVQPAPVPKPVPVLSQLVLNPPTVTLASGATQKFAVTGVWSDGSTTAPAATFAVTGGAIAADGTYTAGTTAGTYRVVATQVGGSKADTSVITITGSVLASNYAHPFSSASPWNTPVASYRSVTSAPTTAFTGFMPAMSIWPGALGVAMYQAKDSDPTVNLYYNANAWINVASGRWKRSGNSAAMEAEIRAGADQKWGGYQGNMYSTTTADQSMMPAVFHARESTYWSLQPRVPAGAVPPPDADGHMTVFQPNGWALEMLAPIRMSNGDIVTMFASYTDPTLLGAGDENGRRASMLPNYAGLIRTGELASGHITHALALGVGPEALAKAVVWPATAMDRTTSNYTGPLPMGALLTIPASVDLTKLNLHTAQGKTLAAAMQEYGGYVTDQTGSHYLLFLSERDASDIPSWNGPLDDDLRAIMAQLKVTTPARN